MESEPLGAPRFDGQCRRNARIGALGDEAVYVVEGEQEASRSLARDQRELRLHLRHPIGAEALENAFFRVALHPARFAQQLAHQLVGIVVFERRVELGMAESGGEPAPLVRPTRDCKIKGSRWAAWNWMKEVREEAILGA